MNNLFYVTIATLSLFMAIFMSLCAVGFAVVIYDMSPIELNVLVVLVMGFFTLSGAAWAKIALESINSIRLLDL